MAKATAQGIDDIKNTVIRSSLELAGLTPWDEMSIEDIARHAGVDMDDMRAVFHEKSDIVAAYEKCIDQQTLGEFKGQSLEGDTPRDRLFDILMTRFDILNDHRAGVVSIINSLTKDPKDMVVSLPWVAKSMAAMLDAANIQTGGWQGALRITGLTAVYIKCLRTWVSDDSDDLSIVMADLDKSLARAEQAAEFFKLRGLDPKCR